MTSQQHRPTEHLTQGTKDEKEALIQLRFTATARKEILHLQIRDLLIWENEYFCLFVFVCYFSDLEGFIGSPRKVALIHPPPAIVTSPSPAVKGTLLG